MTKSDFILQLTIFGMSASIISLLAIRVYPSEILSAKQKVEEKTLQVLAAQTPVKHEKTPPTQITINSLGLDLVVAPGVISNNKWTLYEDKVSWLSTSDSPGLGNVILYAHNRVKLFANLKNLNLNDEIVLTSGEKLYVYKVTNKKQIKPTDVEEILSDKNQLTLYTCDGSFDEKRLVVYATLQTS